MKIYLIILALFMLSFKCKKTELEDLDTNRIIVNEFTQTRVPLFMERDNKDLMMVKLDLMGEGTPVILEQVEVEFKEGYDLTGIDSFAITHTTTTPSEDQAVTGKINSKKGSAVMHVKKELEPEINFFNIDVILKENPAMLSHFQVDKIRFHFSNHPTVEAEPESDFTYRVARVLRAAGEDNCHTYRIPGLITTAKGTLIAVYDNRYNNSKDLQEDVDVGMSRSTDGGQTWEPMKVIMDMGEWGGRPERLNGIGDPSILYDHTTHTIWVAGLWMSGATEKDMLWWASKPGMEPHETGQFILVKSTDDGVSWSEPVNITKQIKDPSWQLLLQGPGRGITLADGTLIFPAQFKADTGVKALDGGQYTSHSTIIYSRDAGETWEIGTGAKPNTTEAQVVQLPDGSLMLNMRDDLNRTVKDENNGRAVAVTSDLGKTWNVHPSSNSVLTEPNCMASIIAADIEAGGKKQQVLFFSNPNHKETRTNMTIKTSFDGGLSWPEENQVELYAPAGFGYSCMTMVDENTIGIVYEGVRELYFQKVPVKDLLKNSLD